MRKNTSKMPNMTEWRKNRYARFNAKIDALRDHPKYEWLRKYADDAMVWNEGFGLLMIKGADFIDRIETMEIAFIRDWLDGNNELKRDEYNAWLSPQKEAQSMKYYQFYEDGTTYLLEIDHDKKLFSVGSFKGKPQRGTRFVEIDQTAYAEHIRRIDRDYQCLDNDVKVSDTVNKAKGPAKKKTLTSTIANAEAKRNNLSRNNNYDISRDDNPSR